MTNELQRKMWDSLSHEQHMDILAKYRNYIDELEKFDVEDIDHNILKGRIRELTELFGSEVLTRERYPRDWKEYEKQNLCDIDIHVINIPEIEDDEKDRAEALLKIAALIKKTYGGLEEFETTGKTYSIVTRKKGLGYEIDIEESNGRQSILNFKSRPAAQNFLLATDNIELIIDLYGLEGEVNVEGV